ncbi:MAG: dihydroneopterin aldolase [Lentisphaeria bacterium]
MNDDKKILRLNCLDQICIPNLRCSGIIGCKPEERLVPQVLFLTLTVFLDTRPAAETEDLNLTVNYAHLSKDVIAFVSKTQYQLLETLANKLATHCLTEYPIEAIKITLCKPAGIASADGAVLEIIRCKEN